MGLFDYEFSLEEINKKQPPPQKLNTVIDWEIFREPLADYARDSISEAIRIAGIPACVTGGGSMFRVHLKEEASDSYRSAYVSPKEDKLMKLLLGYLEDNGILMINTCSATLSTVMTKKEIDILTETLLDGFRKIRPMMADSKVA